MGVGACGVRLQSVGADVRACAERKMYWKMNLFVIVFAPSRVRSIAAQSMPVGVQAEQRTFNIHPLNAMALSTKNAFNTHANTYKHMMAVYIVRPALDVDV